MSYVLYEKKGKIAYITLNCPDRRNAIGDDVADELVQAWVDFRDDDDLWVAILAGAGEAFSVGGDMKGGRRVPLTATNLELSVFALRASPARFEIWKPIIAALHGYVLGAGLWLALGCDIRIAAEDAEFGFPEVKWNITTACSAPLRYYILPGLAYEMLLVGDNIDAQRAYSGGLVNKVVPREELMPTATALAERICENGPLACRAMKEVFWKGKDMSYHDMMALSGYVFAPVRTSEDMAEGRRAFAEKRKPLYKGK